MEDADSEIVVVVSASEDLAFEAAESSVFLLDVGGRVDSEIVMVAAVSSKLCISARPASNVAAVSRARCHRCSSLMAYPLHASLHLPTALTHSFL